MPLYFFRLNEFMIVMPERVRLYPLHVNKKERIPYMLYFANPFPPAEKGGFGDILENDPIKHAVMDIRDNF